MKIFVVRHGELINPRNVLYGRLPGFPLSKEGIGQIKKIGQYLAANHPTIKKIYSSPLERTAETAKILREELRLSEEIIFDDDLLEIDCRGWAGKPLEKFRAAREADFDSVDVESLKESGERVLKVLRQIAEEGEDAIVVSHGDPIMGAIELIAGEQDRYIHKGEFLTIDIERDSWKVSWENRL